MATYYWVGGSGTWNDTSTTPWAANSGGTGGAGVPTFVDNVVFDGNSNVGTGAFTVTTGGTPVCNNFTASGLDGTMTLTVSAALSIYGNFTAQATNFAVTSGAVAIQFVGAGTQTITSNGVTLTATIINCSGSVELADALNVGSRTLTFTAGTFDTKGYNVTAANIATPTTSNYAKTVKFNNSTVTATTAINFYYVDNLTLNAGTSSIVLSNANPTLGCYYGAGVTFYNVSFTNANIAILSLFLGRTECKFNNLSIASPATVTSLMIIAGPKLTVNGTFTLPTGNNYTIRSIFYCIGGTTIDAAAISGTLTDVDFWGTTITGATSPWSGTRLGNGGGNSGISGFAAGTTKYWSLATGGNFNATAWATSSGGTPALANFPLPQDSVVFDDAGLNAGATVTMNLQYMVGSVDFSARTNAMTFTGNQPIVVSGNLTLSSLMTYSVSAASFIGRPGQISTITTNGATTTSAAFDAYGGPSGTVKFADNCTLNFLSFVSGTVDLNGKTITSTNVRKNNPAACVVNLNGGTVVQTGTNFNFPFYSTNGLLTITGTGTFKFSSASTKTINLACVDWSGATFISTGAGAMTLTNGVIPGFPLGLYSTLDDIQTTVRPLTVNFTAGQTFQVNNLTISGTSGNLVTLQSTSAGTKATIYKASGSVSLSFVTIKDIAATGGANFNAFTSNGCVDGGNNSGWDFNSALYLTIYTVRKTKRYFLN